MNQNERKSWPTVTILLVIFISLFIFFSVQVVSALKGALVVETPAANNNSIGVIEIDGVILDSKKIVNRLIEAEKDKNIAGIIVRINSPGGAVGPTQEIYEEIKRIDIKKPVYASFGSVAASGGYYIGAATRKIYTNSGTITGSIGVIMQFMNLSKLFEFVKVEQKNITAGMYKDMGQPNRELTKAEETLLKKLLDDVHKQFIDDIMLKRKDKIIGNIWDHAQGQVFSGLEAQKIGLVDNIGSLWEASRQMHKDLKLPGEVDLYYIKDQKYNSLMDFIDKMSEVISSVKTTVDQSSVSIHYML